MCLTHLSSSVPCGYSGMSSRNSSAPAGVVASLAAPGGNTGWAAGDSYVSVESLLGSVFADQLTGDGGANRLDGRDGNDTLTGGGGNDTLVGGVGADELTGGAGADRFIFSALAQSTGLETDTLFDFSRLEGDRIDLSAIDANATLAGNQAFAFVGTGAFLGGGAGSVRYEQDGGDTLLLVDGGDGGAAEMMIRLAGLHTPLASDLVL